MLRGTATRRNIERDGKNNSEGVEAPAETNADQKKSSGTEDEGMNDKPVVASWKAGHPIDEAGSSDNVDHSENEGSENGAGSDNGSAANSEIESSEGDAVEEVANPDTTNVHATVSAENIGSAVAAEEASELGPDLTENSDNNAKGDDAIDTASNDNGSSSSSVSATGNMEAAATAEASDGSSTAPETESTEDIATGEEANDGSSTTPETESTEDVATGEKANDGSSTTPETESTEDIATGEEANEENAGDGGNKDHTDSLGSDNSILNKPNNAALKPESNESNEVGQPNEDGWCNDGGSGGPMVFILLLVCFAIFYIIRLRKKRKIPRQGEYRRIAASPSKKF